MGSELTVSKHAIKVSIVVACRNEGNHIRAFMDSLLVQDMAGISWEAIIADGMSDDGTRQVLEEYHARHAELIVVDNPGRIVSTGLNAAIRAARGEVVIRMDGHSRYAPDYCRRSLEILEQTGADNVGGATRAQAVGARAQAVAAAYHSWFSTGGAKSHDETYEGWVDTLPYGCWRKSTLLSVGLFDEMLVRNQDDELNLRITRAGGRVWQSPAIVSWYSPRPTLSSLFRQYFQYGFWKVAVIRKHRLPGSWRHVVPMGFVLANIVLLASMIVSKAARVAPWFMIAALTWLAMISAYALITLAVSIVVARRRGWTTLPYLPGVFAVYHFSFGLGSLAGLRWYFGKSASAILSQSMFTRISR
jgi:glycosyltransferase involved in cell wall biosynthesis